MLNNAYFKSKNMLKNRDMVHNTDIKGNDLFEVPRFTNFPVSAFDQHGKHYVIFLYIVRCDEKFYVLPALTAG